MNDGRIELFDELAGVILSLPTHGGPGLVGLAANGLESLDKIEAFLSATGRSEHGLQRGSDIRQAIEDIQADFSVTQTRVDAMRRDYALMRMNSHAGFHPSIRMEY